MVRLVHFPLDCAPLERETLVGGEGYKPLAPLEPEQSLVSVQQARCASGEYVLNVETPGADGGFTEELK